MGSATEESLTTIKTSTNVTYLVKNKNINGFNQKYNFNKITGSAFNKKFKNPNSFKLNTNPRHQSAGPTYTQTETRNHKKQQQNLRKNNSPGP